MKVDDVYINKYNGCHVVIEKINFDHFTINYKYIIGRNDVGLLYIDTFHKCFAYSEKFTEEYIIRKIIE